MLVCERNQVLVSVSEQQPYLSFSRHSKDNNSGRPSPKIKWGPKRMGALYLG
jgi:hypothetical protein